MRDYKKSVLEQIEDTMASAIANQKEEAYNILAMLAKAVEVDKFNQHELRLISVFGMVAMLKNSELSECEDLDKFSEMFRKTIYEEFEEDSSVEFLINAILDLTHDITEKYNKEVMTDIVLINNNKFDNNSDTDILDYITSYNTKLTGKFHTLFLTNIIMANITLMANLDDNYLDMFDYSDVLYSREELLYIVTDVLNDIANLQSSQAILNSKESIIKSILKTYMATTNNQDTKPNRTFESLVSKSKIKSDSNSGKLLN